MKVTDIITEAANPAQQAAIAISMKKAGKKPKSQGVAEGLSTDNLLAKSGFKEIRKMKHGAVYSNGHEAVSIQIDPSDPDVINWALGEVTGKRIEWIESGNDDKQEALHIIKTFTKTEGMAEGSGDDFYAMALQKYPQLKRVDREIVINALNNAYEDYLMHYGYEGIGPDEESSMIDHAVKGLKQGVAEDKELAEEFDLIESIVEQIAEHNGVDADVVWADLESLTEDELYVFAVTSDPLMESQGMAESEAWQKANNRDKTDGMSRKAVKTYRREHPGSKLQTAVTTKPSKLKKGSKASKRRKSYCSRSRGQMKMHSISCAKTPDKAICKARRRWNC